MKFFRTCIFCLIMTNSTVARADMFGGDIIVLAKILANAVQQLIQLQNILRSGKQNLELVRDINKGINDSLGLIQTLNPNLDPGIYQDWKKVAGSIQKLEEIYGIAVDSPNARVQRNLDRGIAEAISKNNEIYKYTKKIDKIGEDIKAFSHSVSPGGAQKLTAESMGVMLHVMNESLRAQATGLKLQAQSAANNNRREKARTRHTLETTNTLKRRMKSHELSFSLPRFN